MPVAVAGAVAAIGGAYMASQTAEKQSDAVREGQQESLGFQRESRDMARGDLEPWRTSGVNANRLFGDYTGLNGAEAQQTAMAGFQTDPGYQFAMDQGLRAVDASAAARGMVHSGAQTKAATAFGQGLATQQYGQTLNRLMGLSQMGQSSAAGSANAALTTGAGMAQTATGAATAQASIYGAEGAAYQKAIGNGLTAFGSIYNGGGGGGGGGGMKTNWGGG